MTGAVRDGNLTKVQDLLREDPALSRAKVMPPGSRTGRMRNEWDGQYIVTAAVREFDDRNAILDALLASGADLNVRLRGRPLLHYAVFAGNIRSVTWRSITRPTPMRATIARAIPSAGKRPGGRATTRSQDPHATLARIRAQGRRLLTTLFTRSLLFSESEQGERQLATRCSGPRRREPAPSTPFHQSCRPHGNRWHAWCCLRGWS